MFKPFKTESTVTSIARAFAWLIVGLVLGSVAVVITHVVVSVL
jgi:predicted DNA repair protein MutK